MVDSDRENIPLPRPSLTVAGFAGGSAVAVSLAGLPISDDTVFLWVLCGLFALSLSDLSRWGRGVIVDWLPLGVLLYFYDTSHGVAQLLGTPTHRALQLNFDRWLLGGPLVAVTLQRWLHQGTAVQPWEYPLFGVYLSHFFVALVILGLLWRFAYPRFSQFRAQIIVLYGLGFLTYVLYPAAPPWMVAHATGVPLHRLVVQLWNQVGPSTASTLFDRATRSTTRSRPFRRFTPPRRCSSCCSSGLVLAGGCGPCCWSMCWQWPLSSSTAASITSSTSSLAGRTPSGSALAFGWPAPHGDVERSRHGWLAVRRRSSR